MDGTDLFLQRLFVRNPDNLVATQYPCAWPHLRSLISRLTNDAAQGRALLSDFLLRVQDWDGSRTATPRMELFSLLADSALSRLSAATIEHEISAKLSAIRHHVERLPSEQKVCLMLVAAAGYSISKAAGILELPEGEVRRHVVQARRELRAKERYLARTGY